MRVLITSVSAGSGHLRAAEALEAAFKIKYPEVEVLHINLMDLVSKTFRKIYEDGYMFLADRVPSMWNWLYETSDKNGNQSSTQRVINTFQRNCANPFLKFLESYRPDVIVTTHFLTAQILSSGVVFPSIPIETVITDYDLHRIWLSPLSRRYYVGDTSIIKRFDLSGIDSFRVVASGIPIHPIFQESVNRDFVFSKYKLDPSIPMVLLLSGGLGFGALEPVVKRLIMLPTPVQLVTVSGKNTELRQRLERLKSSKSVQCRHLGYVSNMHELMGSASFVVSKAGGLTTSECLAKGAPMIITSAIPGQEQKNANFLVSKGAGLWPANLDELVALVISLLQAPSDLSAMRNRARLASNPQAAFVIADSVLHSLCFA